MMFRILLGMRGIILMAGLVAGNLSYSATSPITVDLSAWANYSDSIKVCSMNSFFLPDPEQLKKLLDEIEKQSKDPNSVNSLTQEDVNQRLHDMSKTYQVLGWGQSQCLVKIIPQPPLSGTVIKTLAQQISYMPTICIFPVQSVMTLSQAAQGISMKKIEGPTYDLYQQMMNRYCHASTPPHWTDG